LVPEICSVPARSFFSTIYEALTEPISSLDSPLKAEPSGEFIELQRLLRITIIYIIHNKVEAVALAHHIAIMQKGRIE
jgi:ABC-type sugar transport system ATPase subunit